jgi:large subunit ribosomal protein L3
MLKGLIGKKIGMTQVFDEQGVAFPVTLIEAGPCYVTQVRLPEKDGYSAVQLGYSEVHPKRLSGGERGHLNAHKLPPLRFLREFRSKSPDVGVGDKITVEAFAMGETVDVVGVSKGKGFAGVVKRHHFHGMDATHGTSDRNRAPGSNSSGTTPGRVYRGSRRAGHMGRERVTAQHLKIVLIDAASNLIGLNGAVPGGKGSVVVVKESRKQRTPRVQGQQ